MTFSIAENTNKEQILHFQPDIVRSIGAFLSSQSAEDREEAQDVLSVLANTLKSTLRVEPRIALDSSYHVFELLFTLGESGAGNVYLSNQIQEIVEDTAEALPDDFVILCNQTISLIIKVLDADTYDEENSFTNKFTRNFAIRSCRNLDASACTMSAKIRRTATFAEALKSIVESDIQQLLQWHDGNGKSGLELVLMVIDRLLGPDLPDQSALEIGGLAAEVVDKQPSDVVDFLATNSIGDRSGLQVVLSAWLENSSVFSGYSELRQNAVALANLYALNDPRVSAISVQGEQMAEQTTRIMTRAQRKNNPIRYTSVSAPLKILKILVMELGSGSANASSWKVDMAGSKSAAEEPLGEEDDDWEDDDDTLDLGSHAVKQALLGLGEEDIERSSSAMRRGGDDDTQAFIVNFFREASSNNLGGFHDLYNQLNDDEKQVLSKFIV
ncbi:Importin-9 [Dactylellina cionopaga]|nr:Importin-9 [Dactylellina cionopaga]